MNIGSISESLEDYIEIIHLLQKEKGFARVKDIADRKNVSMSSVNSALKRLDREGLIKYQSRGIVNLTKQGTALAGTVIGRHEFVKNFLVSILNVSEETAERDACSFEHFMSPETFRKLVMFFEFVHASSLDINEHFTDFCNSLQQVQLDRNHQAGPRNNGQKPGRHRFRWGRIKKLSQLKPGERGIVTRIRANQMIRQRLIDMGVLPRVEIFLERIAPLGDPIEIKLRGYHLSIRKDEAEAIWVQPAD